MLEAINIIKQAFIEYVGTGSFMTLFFLSLVYIYKKEEKIEIRNFLWFSLVSLVIILNPIFYMLIVKFIGTGIYWRMFWVLPVGIIIAYIGTKIILKNEKKSEQIIIALSIISIIVLGGKCVFNEQNYQLATNWHKLPQEALDITRMIESDDEKNKRLLVPHDLVAYIRQYDASIFLRYPRKADNYDDEPIVLKMEQGDVKYIVDDCVKYSIKYVVFRKSVKLSEPIENYGFYVLGETSNYFLYKLKK